MLLNRSWGARGHPFAQHYSFPAFLDAQLVLQVAAVGIFFRMWSIASIAQGQALRSIGKAATSLLPPSPPLYFSFQNECASYVGRSGRASVRSRRSADRWFFQLQSQTCHKLVPAMRPLEIEQDCSFRMPLTKWKCFKEVLRTNWFVQDKTSSSKKLRSDSFQKFATASQTLGFEKAVFAPWLLSLSWFMPYNKIMNGEIHVTKNGYDFCKHKETDKIWYATKLDSDERGPYLFSFDCETVFNFWPDYPGKLTPDQIEIFKKENPTMAALK